MSLTVSVTEEEKGVVTVSPVGQIDSSTYEEFFKRIEPVLNGTARVMVLNMEGVDYISSMGISVILKARKAIEGNSGTFLMVNLQPQIEAVFDIVKALPSIRVFKNLQEADNYLAAMQRKVKLRHKEEAEE